MEVLDVRDRLQRRADVDAERRRAVRRERHVAALADPVGAQHVGDPADPGDVGLQDVDAVGEVPQLRHVPLVFAGGDRDAGRPAVTEQPQPLAVLGGDRLLEVGDAPLRVALGPEQRLLGAEGAVGVDEELGPRSDRPAGERQAARIFVGVPPDLDLDARNAGLDPAAELLAELLVVEVREAAAAVDRYAFVEAGQEVGERQLEQASLQVPERDVDCGDRHRADPRAARVAELVLHRRRGGGGPHRVGATDEVDQLGLDQRRDGSVAVGVAEPALVAGVGGDDDARRRLPGQRAVALGLGQRHLEDAHVGAVDCAPARRRRAAPSQSSSLPSARLAAAQRFVNSLSLPLKDCLMIRPEFSSPPSSALPIDIA